MKDDDLTRSNGNHRRTGGTSPDIEPSVSDIELTNLLATWIAPVVPASLDQRVLSSFRSQSVEVAESSTSVNNGLPGLTLLPTQEVNTMKECSTCLEQFASKFVFCPIDGTPLDDAAIEHATSIEMDGVTTIASSDEGASTFPFVSSGAYNLTIIEDAGLVRRLVTELGEASRQSRLTWPELKRDPVGFTRRSLAAYGSLTWRFFSGPNVAVASLVAILFMMTAVIGLVWLDRNRTQTLAMRDKQRNDLEFQGMVDIPDEQEDPKKGTAGTNKGDGGGSKPKQDKAGGGGGGGRDDLNPASKGKLPPADPDVPQVRGPDIKLPPIPNASLPVPAHIDMDKLLAKTDNRDIPFGMPNSTATTPSNGPGQGGGMGTGDGMGAGSGEDGGLGPGRGGNTGGGDRHMGGGGPGGGGEGDFNRTFKPNEVTQKARILSKPTPEYTEAARKNQVVGTVTLQMVFSSSGAVTSIRTISGLPHGLTEKAIAAAQRIKFSPAMKDGRPVSQYIKVEYNFNIY